MNLSQFYETVLPPTGNYTLFTAGNKRHLWANTLDGLAELTTHQNGTDVYFATATFDEPTSRTQVNVQSKRAFYLDLDAGAKKFAKHGPDKTYETQRDALQGVKDFIKSTGLMPTLVVSSGEGLHLYWALTESTPGPRWTPLAKLFQKFAAAAGLKVDSSVTGDSARVLRPIGTTHPNGKTVTLLSASGPKYTLEAFAAAIGTPMESKPKFSAEELAVNDDLVMVQGPPKSMKKMLEHCGAARYAAANQDAVEEPYWHAMIGLAKHSVEGRDIAHAISCRHPDYDEGATDKKFDLWTAGPSTCTRMAEFNPKACGKCPHQGKVKSPIQLGAMNVTEVGALPPEKKPTPAPAPKVTDDPWSGFIPQGFDVVKLKGKRTLVAYLDIEVKGQDDEKIPMRITVPISYEIFWLGHWADASHSEDTAQTTLYRLDEYGLVSHFTMDQSIIASKVELSKFYASKGIHTTTDSKALHAMEAYTKASLQMAKLRQRRPKIHDRMGLVILPDNRLICAQGKYAIMPDGTITETVLSPALRTVADNYTIPLPASAAGTWDSSVWKNFIVPKAQIHANFMRRYYSDPGLARYQLAFMLGLSSPLMAFVDGGYTQGTRLPRNGLTVSLYSKDGGKGKTTVIQSAALAYGYPKELSKDSNKVGTTDLGRIGTMSLAGTMPVGMDEMGSTSAEAMAGLVSAVANGTSRTRMTKDGGLVNMAPWALIAMMAANKSAREMISENGNESNAIQYRLLEIDVDSMPEFGIDAREEFVNDWEELYKSAGALGALIHLAICKTGAESMSAMVRQNVNSASRMINSVQGDRFQYRGLAAMLTLQYILEKLGLAMFGTNLLIDTFKECHASAGEYIKDNTLTSNGFELLSKALHDLTPNTAITHHGHRRTGHNNAYEPALGRMPDKVLARHIVDEGITYVSVEALRDWCVAHKVRMTDMLKPNKDASIMKHVYSGGGSVGSGSKTQWAGSKNLLSGMESDTTARVSCYAFSTTSLAEKVGSMHLSLEAMLKASEPPPPLKVVPIKAKAA